METEIHKRKGVGDESPVSELNNDVINEFVLMTANS